MNCERAQELILTSDDPASFALGEADLAQHVGGCADCRSLLARLGRIEAAAAALPPVVEGSEEGLRATLERVRATERTPAPLHRHQVRRPWIPRPALVGAMAAALLVGVGITAYMWPEPAPQTGQQAAVVEELIDFDQSLAEATPEERERLYAEQAPVLRSAVDKVALSEKDRQLARTVLERSANQPEDPVAQAERLGDLSELLERQLGKAAAANDELAIQRLGRKFGHVQRGIGAKVADVAPERTMQQVQKLERQEMMQKRLETIRQRQEEARKRLQKLAERSPEKAQRILQRMLENERQRQQQGALKRPATRPAATQPRLLDPNLH